MFNKEQLHMLYSACMTAATVSQQHNHVKQANDFNKLGLTLHDMSQGRFAHEGYSFTDADVVNWEDYKPNQQRGTEALPFLIHDEYGLLAVVFGDDASAALEIAAIYGKMDRHKVSDEEANAMTEEEQERLTVLSNNLKGSDHYNLENVRTIQLSNPQFSFVALMQYAVNGIDGCKVSQW
jgi:hypothetical protein